MLISCPRDTITTVNKNISLHTLHIQLMREHKNAIFLGHKVFENRGIAKSITVHRNQQNGSEKEGRCINTPIRPHIRRYSSRIFCIFCLSSFRYAQTSCSFNELAGNFVPTTYQQKRLPDNKFLRKENPLKYAGNCNTKIITKISAN